MKSRTLFALPLALSAVMLVGPNRSFSADGLAPEDSTRWPRFRGQHGAGISQLKGIPVEWSTDDYEWVVELPGVGHSSPAVWEDKLFLTSGDGAAGRLLLCLNALTGEQLWQQKVQLDPDHLHTKNSNGSCSPAVDGERVYVAFADDTQYLFSAYDLDGNPIWTKDLGPFETQHGQGQSPVVIPDLDLVVLTNDQQGPSFVAAFNRRTGDEVWRTPRAARETAYSTPLLLSLPGEPTQLICNAGATGVTSLDPATGRQLWTTGELPMRSVSSPVYGNGVVIASSGSGGVGKYMAAVDPTDADDPDNQRIVWERDIGDKLPYVPTSIVYGTHLFMWTDQGIVVCADMATGKTLSQKRAEGGNYTSSPIIIDGKLYNVSESGEVVVVTATPELEILGRSQLGDQSHATPAVANGRLYLRGFTHLACLKAH